MLLHVMAMANGRFVDMPVNNRHQNNGNSLYESRQCTGLQNENPETHNTENILEKSARLHINHLYLHTKE